MGRVFQYQEIEAELVPDLAAFQAAADAFSEQVIEAVDHGFVDGAFVFGSVAGLLNHSDRATPNRRSDMDSLVVLNDYTPETLSALKRIARAINEASGGRVPSQPIVYQRDQLINGHIPGMHEMDQMFGTDLLGFGRFVVGNDPAHYMRFPEADSFDAYNAFIAQKRRKLHNGLAQEPETEQGVRTVQRFLELPVSMGRKAVQALILDGQLVEDTFWAADKRQVLRITAEELFADDETPVTLMNKILCLERDYDELLDKTMDGAVSQQEYTSALRDIANYSLGIEWLNYVHVAISAKLYRSNDNTEYARPVEQ